MKSAHAVRLIAGSIAALLVAACDKPAETAPLPPPVRIARAEAADADAGRKLQATGLVRLAEEVPLAFKIGGVVREVSVVAGQTVTAGQTLAALDPAEIDAQVTNAREALVRADREVERARMLFVKGMVAQRVERDARTLRDQAKAALDAAQFNRRHAVIAAPAAGVVLQKRAEARETVAAGQPLLVLGRLDRGWVVRAGLPAGAALRLARGDPAQVRLDASDAQLAGRIARIAAASDARTGTVEVEVALDKPAAALVSGMVARIDFKLQSSQHGAKDAMPPTVPLSAVLEGEAGRARMFVVAAGKAKRLDVRTGRILGDRIEIVEGLPDAADIVVEGAAWLSDGDAVRVLK